MKQLKKCIYFIVEKKYDTQNGMFEKNDKFDKSYPSSGVNSYVTSALKASNDSGCKEFELKGDTRNMPYILNINNSSECLDQVSDGDEDDEDLLTACINIGMQNNR